MKNILTIVVMLISMTIYAQVGINNTSPNATLDITAKTTDGSKPEGLIIPQLSGSNIHTATATGVYGSNQKGLIIYATSADSSPTSATANITAAGYYYFDGGAWQKVMTGSVANADLVAGVGGIYKGSGSLSGNTTVTQGASTLAFTSTTTNGFSVDGTTLSVDAANNRVGIGTITPSAMLHVYGTSGDHIRLTSSASDWALGSENAGGQNGIPGQSSFNITDRVNGVRRMTIGVDNSFRLGGNIAVGNAALSIDGPTNKVGIGINVPNATLDVKAASNGSTPEGIIAPRLSLTALQGYAYGTNQTGAIVYVNSASGTPTGQTANVTATGYYFFDGGAWQRILETSSGDTTNDAWVNDTTNSVVKLGTKANGTARTTGTDVVVKDDGKVGIGTASPGSLLDLVADNKGTAGQDDISLSSYNSTGSPSPGLVFNVARGTAAAPANLQNGDEFANIISTGRIGGNVMHSSSIITRYKGDGTTNLSSITFNASGSNRMLIDENGKIGIATSAPKSYLHVSTPTAGGTIDAGIFSIDNCGSSCTQNTARNIVLNNSNVTNTTFASLDFVPSTDPTAASGASIQGIDRDATNNYAGLSFFTRNATDYNSRMVIKSSGNVGIGTQSPNAKLHTVSSTAYGAFQMQDGSEGTGKFLSSNASGQATWVNSPLTPVVFGNLNTTGATVTDNMYLNSNITLPKGKWLIYVGLLLSGSGGSSPSATNNRWVRLTLGSNNSGTGPTVSGFNFLASSLVSGWLSPITDYYRYTFLSGVIPVEVTNSSSILYLWTKDSRIVGTDPGCVIANNGENYLFAVPAY